VSAGLALHLVTRPQLAGVSRTSSRIPIDSALIKTIPLMCESAYGEI
jgi:hypothetical protein